MTEKIKLGFIGANIRSAWASQSHYPAIAASRDVELTAVCTTNPTSAEEARVQLGARFAFSDYKEMIISDAIDAVVIVVRVPSHFALTLAAIEAGKHVYTEWPLGVTTSEAEELCQAAKTRRLITATGLQARVTPELMYMRQLIADGFIGDILSCHVSCFRPGPLKRPANRTWTRDVNQGANPLTIQAGHIIDTLRYVAGEFTGIQASVTTQAKKWWQTDKQQFVDVTSPDNIIITGKLNNDAIASVHVGNVPFAPSGFKMEIYGHKGSLKVTHPISSNHGNIHLSGCVGTDKLEPISPPDYYLQVAQDFPKGAPHAVGQTYALFAQGIRSGKTPDFLPTFETALEMHKILDVIRKAAASQVMIKL